MALATEIVTALAVACLALHLSVACVPNKGRLTDASGSCLTGNAGNVVTQDCIAQRRIRPVVACFLEARSETNPPSLGEFGIGHINATLCTHLVYCNVGIDVIRRRNRDHSETFTRLRALRTINPDLKITVAFGGLVHSNSYSSIVRNSQNRINFAESVVAFLREHQLDGLDLDWRYPKGRQQKKNYVLLCQELYQEFRKHNWQLTVTINRIPSVLEAGYDLDGLAEHTDYLYLLAYAYHGQWEDFTGHSAPLYSRPWEPIDQKNLNVNFTVSKVLSKVPASKLVVGIFLSGVKYLLHDRNAFRIGASASWKDELTYHEVCRLLCSEGPNWTVDRDDNHKVSYTYSDKNWIAYEDEWSIEHKMNFFETLNLRGAFVWTLDADAYSGCCGASATPYPLLTKIHNRMKLATDKRNAVENAPTSVVTCFLDSLSVYRSPPDYFTIEDIDTSLCTHIIYCYVGIDEIKYTIVDTDPVYGKSAYKRLLRLKKKNPFLVITVSVGGPSEESEKYSRMAADPTHRLTFIASVVNFLRDHQLDGIDLAWDSPAQRGGRPEDKENFVLLCQEIRYAFRRMNWLFTVSASGNGAILDQGYNLTEIAREVDLLHLLAFNYNGPSVTGHPSPLKPLAWKEGLMNDSVQYSLLYALARSVLAKKIVLVVTFIGSTYTLTNASNHGLGAPSHEPGPFGLSSLTHGTIGYNGICEFMNEEGRLWELAVDQNRGLPYMYRDDLWIAYENVSSIGEKALLARSWMLAGLGAWTVSTDDFRGRCGMGKFPLLTEVNRVLGRLVSTTTAPPEDDDTGPSGTWCSVVEQVDVTVAVVQCGSSTHQDCIVDHKVPPQTLVFANCWNTTELTMVCRPDGFWIPLSDDPDQHEDPSTTNGDRMELLCQPDLLNSLICGRKPRYERKPGAFLDLQSFYNETEHRWPWVVKLYRDDEYICAGTIVSAVHLITAAHCIMKSRETRNETIEVDRVTLKVNNLNLRRKVIEIQPHPDLLIGKHNLVYDIAMLKFNEPVTFNRKLYPACVNFKDDLPERHGVAFKRKPTNDSLYTVVEQTLSRNCSSSDPLCSRLLPTLETQFCGENLDEESDLDEGDSGGPFMQDLSSRAGEEQWAVTGVVSQNTLQALLCSRPLVMYTAVHTVRGWIMMTSQLPLE